MALKQSPAWKKLLMSEIVSPLLFSYTVDRALKRIVLEDSRAFKCALLAGLVTSVARNRTDPV